jgi:hypothetical protein
MKNYDHTFIISEWERMGRPEALIYDEDRSNEWIKCDESYLWQSHFQYRIKSKPWINWEHVSDDVKWMATDKNGDTFLYCNEPRINDIEWFLWNCYTVYPLSSFTRGTCDWKDSLVMRPVVIGDK